MIDEKKLKIKIDELFNTDIVLKNDIGKNKDLYNFIINLFSKDELDYINAHHNLLEPYIDIELDATIVKKNSNYFLETSIGTYFLANPEPLKNDKIRLKDLNDILNRCSHSHLYDSNANIYDYILIELVEKYAYYKLVKSKNVAGLNFLCTWKNLTRAEFKLFEMPIEFFDNPTVNFYVAVSSTTIFENLKSCYDAGYKFDNNPRLMFLMIIYTDFDNNYIKQHMTEFKHFIIENGFNRYAVVGYDYMKKNLLEYLDEEFLTTIYKKSPSFFFHDYDIFYKIAEKISNNSPMIKLTSKLPPCHLKYNPYDLYAGKPACFGKDALSDFERRFLDNNNLIIKLYNRYYKSYKMSIKNEQLDNLYNFIKTLLLNPNNFKNVVNSSGFSVKEVTDLILFKHSLSPSEQERFDIFYNKFRQEQHNKWINLHNELAKNKNNILKCKEIFEKFGCNKENVFHIVLNNKFMNKKVKSVILDIANVCYGKCVKVIDIIDILDEMLDRNLTINEILNEREISKKAFEQLYQDSFENNRILYEYIKLSLSKNKRLGYRKLINLGYTIINSNLESYSEFTQKFPNYDYTKIVEDLKDTELEEQLKSLATSWEDYQVEVKQ